MAGQIPQRFLDDLLARVDVVEVVSERVELKKSGRNYSGLCPFHQEKSPSFTVSADKQFYHCFGCGAHGNALRFLMEYDRLPFPEAVEQLAGRLGLEVPRDGQDDPRAKEREQKRKEGVNLLELSSRYFRQQLVSTDGQAARDYLERRGLSQAVIKAYGIGHAPAQWDALKRHLIASGVSEEVQIEYGLLIHHEDSGRRYDRFRDRVMFPIRDLRGRTIAFGGRVLGDAKPKYLNSPETPVFHKGRELYGLYEARQSSDKLEQLILVEGYMDVVALAQHGVKNAVATLGTATTSDHLKRLFRLVSRVVFCFDGDRAGRQAASRALETALPHMIDGREARFLFLPDGDDPDDLVRREGMQAFMDRVTCAMPLSEFLFEQAAKGRDLNTVEGRERFASQVLDALGQIPEGVLRSLLHEELARRSGLRNAQIAALDTARSDAAMEPGRDGLTRPGPPLASRTASPASLAEQAVQRRSKPPSSRSGTQGQPLTPVARIIQLLVHEPGLIDEVPDTASWLPAPGTGTLDESSAENELCGELIALQKAGHYRSPQVLLAHFQGSRHGQRLTELARRELLIPKAFRATELSGLLEHLGKANQQRSPSEEYDALIAQEKAGEPLNADQRRRLGELLQALAGDRW